MKSKLTLSILALITAVFYSCSAGKQDKVLGSWVSTNQKDSISEPIIIYEKGEQLIVKSNSNGKLKEFPATWDASKKFLVVDLGMFKAKVYYYADSDIIKLSTINGAITARRANDSEIKKRAENKKRLGE